MTLVFPLFEVIEVLDAGEVAVYDSPDGDFLVLAVADDDGNSQAVYLDSNHVDSLIAALQKGRSQAFTAARVPGVSNVIRFRPRR